jgi:DNA-binding NarL/FixJ family response regulator
MNTAVRRSPVSGASEQRGSLSRGERKTEIATTPENAAAKRESRADGRMRVCVATENRLLREALSRMLTRRGDIEVVGLDAPSSFEPEGLLQDRPDILLLTTRGNLTEDIAIVRRVRSSAPSVRILVVGITDTETDFFQYVRAGIKGYLPPDASAEEVLAAMRSLQAGEAVCPGKLCATLFRFFEREATVLPSATIHQKLGLTRREQQIVPLLAQGLTNKEIANQFCLSEQTIKNHLYRMKHKIGAPDRLGIIQLCRTQGFLV